MSYPITKQGFERLQQELKHYKTVERPRIVKQISIAREYGDLSENAEYQTAKDSQRINDRRISELENIALNAKIIDVKNFIGDSKIRFGATVTLLDEQDKEIKYQIVSEYESNTKEGKISYTSPIGKGLINKEVEDFVEIVTPGGIREFEILKVVYKL